MGRDPANAGPIRSAIRVLHASPSSNRIPCRNSSFDSRCRQRITSTRTASRAPIRSRSASSSRPGTRTGCGSPASSNRASSSASRRSVLTGSPDSARNLRPRRDYAPDLTPPQLPRQPVPGRARLIRRPHRTGQPRAEPGHTSDVRGHRKEPKLARLHVQHRRDDLRRVHVQTDESSSLRHGWFLPCACGRRAGCHPHGKQSPHARVAGNRPISTERAGQQPPYGLKRSRWRSYCFDGRADARPARVACMRVGGRGGELRWSGRIACRGGARQLIGLSYESLRKAGGCGGARGGAVQR